MKKVVRTNKWHSVEVCVRRVHGVEKEIRLSADQKQRGNSTYLTPKSARELAMVLLRAAEEITELKK